MGVGDLVTFGCALALVFSPLAGASYTLIMGYIMVANQARLDCVDGDQQRRFPSRAKAYLATCLQLLHPHNCGHLHLHLASMRVSCSQARRCCDVI